MKELAIRTESYEMIDKSERASKDEVVGSIDNHLDVYYLDNNLFAFNLIVWRYTELEGGDYGFERGGSLSGVG